MKTKKFKLKKWYPSLPKRAKNRETIARTHGCYSDRFAIEIEGDYTGDISKEEVENNPEFWEPVVDKDYEILSFKDGCLFKRYAPHKFKQEYADFFFTEQQMIDDGAKIHSVKRLSDGEVFTVGDKVQHWIPDLDKHSKWTVSSFKIVGNIMYLCSGTGFKMDLEAVGKRKEPLFTTKDGVDIYEGDRYYYTDKSGKGIITCYPNANRCGSAKHRDKYVYFSTKEKAQEWLDENEPQYSKADIKRVANKIDNHLNTVNVTVGELLLREFLLD